MTTEADTPKKGGPEYEPLADGPSAENGGGKKVMKHDGPYLCKCLLPFDIYPWLMLLCICWLTFGSYWVFDTPGAIFTQLQKWFGGKDQYTSGMNLNLYSIYSWPNTVLAFFGGYIIDRVTGIRKGAMLFCFFILLGQFIFALGVQSKSYWTCFMGRFVFGLGGESLTVAQNSFTVRWFEGPKLALAFGLVLAFARVGSSVNFVVTPILANSSNGVPLSVWVGFAACCLSLLACIMATFLDWYGQKRVTNPNVQPEAPVSITAVRHFPLSAWLLMLICLFFYICVLTFYTVASDIMQNTGRHYADETATLFLSIPNFVSIIGSPFFGRMVDRKGRALVMIFTASSMMIVAHVVFLALATELIDIHPVVIMLWLGVGYSLGAASIWPILSIVIDEQLLSTGYGCMTAVQNAGLALFPLIIGQLQDSPSIKGTTLQYTLPIMIFIGCAVVAIILTVVLIGVDKKNHGGLMNASSTERQARKKAKEEAQKLLAGKTASDSDTNTSVTISSSS